MKKEKNRWTIIKTISISDFIQIFISLVLLGTLIFTFRSIYQQYKFNRNALRPWIYVEPAMTLEILYPYGSVRIMYTLKNIGKTPGYHLEVTTTYTHTEDFPIEKLRAFKEREEPFSKAYIFPNQELKGYSPLKKKVTSKDDLMEFLVDEDVYLHCYLTYLDFDKNEYFFRITFSISNVLETIEGYSIFCVVVDASETRI